MKKKFNLLMASFLIIGTLSAQDNNGLAMLKIDVDARASAMAGMYTTLANDASASYYNPSLLAIAENPSIVATHNKWILDITHSYAAIQFARGNHNFALSFNFMQTPGIDIRGNVPTAEPLGTIDAFNLAAGLSYATTLSDWQVGATLNYLFEKYYLSTAPGWAIDLGVLRKDLLDGVDFGFVVKNMGKMSTLKNEASPLPLMVQTSFSYHIPNFFDDKLLISPGLQWVSQEKVYFGLGTEFQVVDYLAIRAGVKNGVEELLWSFGLGLNYNSFQLNYAYSPLEFDFVSPTNMFSLRMSY
jgi:hypothetical protein